MSRSVAREMGGKCRKGNGSELEETYPEDGVISCGKIAIPSRQNLVLVRAKETASVTDSSEQR